MDLWNVFQSTPLTIKHNGPVKICRISMVLLLKIWLPDQDKTFQLKSLHQKKRQTARLNNKHRIKNKSIIELLMI